MIINQIKKRKGDEMGKTKCYKRVGQHTFNCRTTIHESILIMWLNQHGYYVDMPIISTIINPEIVSIT
jgi:hypothetical protein